MEITVEISFIAVQFFADIIRQRTEIRKTSFFKSNKPSSGVILSPANIFSPICCKALSAFFVSVDTCSALLIAIVFNAAKVQLLMADA